MKTAFVVLSIVFLGWIATGNGDSFHMTSSVVGSFSPVLNATTVIIQPSPTVSKKNSTTHSSAHPNVSTHIHSASKNMSIHNHTSSIPSTKYHNSTIMPNTTITPSPSTNFSYSINMTSMYHNASHMTYTVVPTHSIYPSNATSSIFPSNATSSVVPSSSVTPTTTPPPPKLPKGKFSVKKGNDSCLLFWLSLEFGVKYKNKNGTEVTRMIVMPNSSYANANGQCGKAASCIDITWDFYSVEACFLTALTVKRDAAAISWLASNITIKVVVANNSKFVDFGSNVTEISETLQDRAKLNWLSGFDGHSLNCSQKETVQIGDSITADFENVRIQPFSVEGNKFSDKVDSCLRTPTPTSGPSKKKKTNNTVAIAVGCTLGALVLIVLIGYFIGKRRKNAIRYRKL